jgi:hypothetical protein
VANQQTHLVPGGGERFGLEPRADAAFEFALVEQDVAERTAAAEETRVASAGRAGRVS